MVGSQYNVYVTEPHDLHFINKTIVKSYACMYCSHWYYDSYTSVINCS